MNKHCPKCGGVMGKGICGIILGFALVVYGLLQGVTISDRWMLVFFAPGIFLFVVGFSWVVYQWVRR